MDAPLATSRIEALYYVLETYTIANTLAISSTVYSASSCKVVLARGKEEKVQSDILSWMRICACPNYQKSRNALDGQKEKYLIRHGLDPWTFSVLD
jgi:hypothetical protein